MLYLAASVASITDFVPIIENWGFRHYAEMMFARRSAFSEGWPELISWHSTKHGHELIRSSLDVGIQPDIRQMGALRISLKNVAFSDMSLPVVERRLQGLPVFAPVADTDQYGFDYPQIGFTSLQDLFIYLPGGPPAVQTECVVDPMLSLYFDNFDAFVAVKVSGLSMLDKLVIRQSAA